MSTSTEQACVCVQDSLRKSVHTTNELAESQEGGLCENTHKQLFAKAVNYTTTTTMHFASSSVSELYTFASTLLVQSEVVVRE